jgi:chromosome segregation ATPase
MAEAEAERLQLPSPLPKAGRQFKFPDDLFKLEDRVGESVADVATLRKVVGVLSETLKSYREEEGPRVARAISAAEEAAKQLAQHVKDASEAEGHFLLERNALVRSLNDAVRLAAKELRRFEEAAAKVEGAHKRVEVFSLKLDLLDDKVRQAQETFNNAVAELFSRVKALEDRLAGTAKRPPAGRG